MIRKIFSGFLSIISAISISFGFLNMIANVGSQIRPDNLPTIPVLFWFLSGLVGIALAMIIWPHKDGLWNYLKEIA
ncbi:MAG: hypothetical protein A2271_00235 [Candidatus Moranbacteria bacterium RIFOXYA12_FULL_35_19]|nr:MAG: hypothetical protein UR78_C0004G0025 [Candidatus Moranbacteria bacterium GW2011_GWF2_35_39]OGI32202.1 MAG: hypothetical protein A2343_00360 [Candidatus Moranbacteria bacterium RIFOXYB12_FULL_35_8]OGI32827.1 MAG: hypothetical protein A2489_01795 [Candidatus Moranbacteria bacterium RIFOXYC12_FULL_36_13]OGI36155.1 MAG: hypothetical protein A2271_00235 [Candidatus Moranbacteria bacterium RIFOXYA12_FULL_35_19]